MLNFTLDNALLQKGIHFFKKYGIFIAPILLFLVFMFLLIFSYSRPPQQSSTITASPSQTRVSSTPYSPSQQTVSVSPAATSGEGMQSDEKAMTVWSNVPLSDSDFANLDTTKTTLSDGSTQYMYASAVANRPNIVIIKDGINVFQRTPFTDTTLSENTNFYGQSEYIAKGSQFWGPNAMTYIYLSRGIALVGDTHNDQLLEQILFQPGTIDQFKQYDTDLSGDVKKF